MSTSTENLKRKARMWLDTKQEVESIQREAAGVRKRLKLHEQELVRHMSADQVEELEVDGVSISRAKSIVTSSRSRAASVRPSVAK